MPHKYPGYVKAFDRWNPKAHIPGAPSWQPTREYLNSEYENTGGYYHPFFEIDYDCTCPLLAQLAQEHSSIRPNPQFELGTFLERQQREEKTSAPAVEEPTVLPHVKVHVEDDQESSNSLPTRPPSGRITFARLMLMQPSRPPAVPFGPTSISPALRRQSSVPSPSPGSPCSLAGNAPPVKHTKLVRSLSAPAAAATTAATTSALGIAPASSEKQRGCPPASTLVVPLWVKTAAVGPTPCFSTTVFASGGAPAAAEVAWRKARPTGSSTGRAAKDLFVLRVSAACPPFPRIRGHTLVYF